MDFNEFDITSFVVGGGRKAPKQLDVHEVVNQVTLDTSECAPGVENIGGICLSKHAKTAIVNKAGAEIFDINDAVEKVKKQTGCNDTVCTLSKLPESETLINESLKPSGPRNTTGLLSNFNIDHSLGQWALEFDTFYPCPFAMVDFATCGDHLGTVDMKSVMSGVSSGFKLLDGSTRVIFDCFGCVMNTDYSTGGGKHWVAIFVDCREGHEPWTVEYFNSTGNPPPKQVVVWMEETTAALSELNKTESVIVTKFDHQESQTECGNYSLYFIRCRLENVPVSFFNEGLISDDAMIEFRKRLFRD